MIIEKCKHLIVANALLSYDVHIHANGNNNNAFFACACLSIMLLVFFMQ